MTFLQSYNSERAPMATGPFSQSVAFGGLLHCSGQLPLDGATMTIIGADCAEQTRQCLSNLAAVCEAAGTSLVRAIKVTVSLTDMAQFPVVNEVYGQVFEGSSPARVVLGVQELPRGALVEIDAVVALED